MFVFVGLLCLPWSRIKTKFVWWMAYSVLTLWVGITVITVGWLSCTLFYDSHLSVAIGAMKFGSRSITLFVLFLFSVPVDIIMLLQPIVIWRMRTPSA